MSPEELTHGAASHIGLQRPSQQDAMLTSKDLYLVADGMGGHAAGDVAAQTAAEVIGEATSSGTPLADAVKQANEEILRRASADPGLQGMGTTVTAISTIGEAAKVAHVGDSRAYLLREGELRRLTRDHTSVDRLVRQGRISEEEALEHPARHRLERALGISEEIEVDVDDLGLHPGDRLMLCTDGLSGSVTDSVIEEVLKGSSDPQRAADKLVEVALRTGGADNVTTIVIDVAGTEEASPSMTEEEVSRKPKARRRLIAGAIAVVVALGGLAAVARARSNSYYIGEESGQVAVFKGWPGEIMGYELGDVAEQTDIQVESLPEPFDERVKEGIPVDDLEDALEQIEHLRSLPDPEPDDIDAP